MLDRLLLVLLLGVFLLLAVLAVRRWNGRRISLIQKAKPDWTALGTEPDRRRTVIAFSTPSCAACHTAQVPAIDRVRDKLGEDAVRVIRVDAAKEPAVASAFGILTVPATVVVAADGERILAVNQGFAPSARLAQQLELG